jgi:hypothetical protein
VYPKWRPARILSLLLASIPFVYLVFMCARHHADVPFWDEWEMVPRLDHMASGTLSLHDVWRQQNEHRPMFPVLTMLLLARMSGWNIDWEIAVNVLLGAGIFAVFWAYLRTTWRSRGGAPFWLLPLVSVLVFSPVQWENWTWGFQMIVLMCVLAGLLACWLVASSAGRDRRVAAAIVCAVWATYSFGSGLLVWIAQPAGIWITGGRRRAFRLAVWTVAAALTMATYFYGYQRPAQPSMLSSLASFASAKRTLHYFLVYLGTPVTAHATGWAAWAGLALVMAFSFLVIRLRALRDDPIFVFPALVGLQMFAIATAASLGRSWMGVEQAMSSRYCVWTIPLWCSVLCLTALWRATAPVRVGLQPLVTAVGLTLILWGAWASGRQGVYYAAGRAENLRLARRGLITGRSNAMLLMLYPDLDVVRQRRAVLLRLRLSVFRPTPYPTYPVPGPP